MISISYSKAPVPEQCGRFLCIEKMGFLYLYKKLLFRFDFLSKLLYNIIV